MRLEILLTASSLAKRQCDPMNGHRHAVIKTFGHLKTCPERDIAIDSTELSHSREVKVIKTNFGNQHCEFDEVNEMDDKGPNPLMDEIGMTVFTDANHGHGAGTS